jgi:hypothetical protein
MVSVYARRSLFFLASMILSGNGVLLATQWSSTENRVLAVEIE